MVTLKRILAGLLLGMVAWSCGREDPGETIGPAQFYFSGEMGGLPFQVEVGPHDYEMVPTFNQDEEGYYQFSGLFSQINSCVDNCQGNLQLSILDQEASAPGSPSFINQWLTGPQDLDIKIIPDDQIQYKVHFSALSQGQGSVALAWDLGEGVFSSETTPSHTYPHDPEVTTVPVCLVANFSNGCSSTICNDIALPTSSCRANFDYAVSGDRFFVYSALAAGREPLEYKWSFSSGAEAVSVKVDYDYHLPVGVDTVRLAVTDQNGCFSLWEEHVAIDNGLVDCVVNFDYSVETEVLPYEDEPLPKSVEIGYVDAQGRSWEAVNGTLPAQFRVTSVGDYQNSVEGFPTKRVGFDLRVYLTNGETTRLLEGSGFMAVAYPAN